MEKLSFSLEDYIEEIYNQVLKNGQAKVTAIADALGVRKASVTGALNVLSEKKLINYAPYSPITLTAQGEKIAKEVLKKHENLAEFFVEVLNIPRDEAIEIACKMEHIVSDKLFDNMVKLTEYVKSSQMDLKKIF
ncbi:TPA: metal-dependent transcriptional regulator [Candidatus Gastranaerophilales bacterium HUM_20]|nr:iron (Metal) dependent repressor DtxR family [Clostridium sp. CAG:729]DAB25017.1 MAG TPA: metal-dependent transcriptional regulator [Candidatus Gastranaerophilales bacterium HUM_20]